jgi:DNA-binding phage protein
MEEAKGRAIHRCGCPDCQQSPESFLAQRHGAINTLLTTLDERSRRLVAAFVADQLGRGGITKVARITGMSRNTIRRGQRELIRPEAPSHRIRRPGGGRMPVEKKIPGDLGRP